MVLESERVGESQAAAAMAGRGREQSPSFFKIYFPQLSAEQLLIPPKFRNHLELNGTPATVSLKGPSGNIWGVDVVTNSDGLFFGNGWKDFVVDHSLATGDFVVFRYMWRLCFTVLVFDTTACEKESAFLATPSNEKRGDDGKAKGRPKKMNDKDSPQLVSTAPSCKGATISGAGIQKWASNGKPRGLPKTRIHPSGESLDDKNCLQQRASEVRPKATITPRHEAVPASETRFLRSMTNKKTGLVTKKTLLSKVPLKIPSLAVVKKRCKRLISQRRPVTHEEVYKTVVAANKFESSNPFFMVKMSNSTVYYNFFLSIPRHFVKVYLPRRSIDLTLWDLKERSWVVGYLSLKTRGGLNLGWCKFCYGNNLEKDDVCVFELIQEYHLRVHIFRVVEDITPLIPNVCFRKRASLMDRGGML